MQSNLTLLSARARETLTFRSSISFYNAFEAVGCRAGGLVLSARVLAQTRRRSEVSVFTMLLKLFAAGPVGWSPLRGWPGTANAAHKLLQICSQSKLCSRLVHARSSHFAQVSVFTMLLKLFAAGPVGWSPPRAWPGQTGRRSELAVNMQAM